MGDQCYIVTSSQMCNKTLWQHQCVQLPPPTPEMTMTSAAACGIIVTRDEQVTGPGAGPRDEHGYGPRTRHHAVCPRVQHQNITYQCQY